MLSAALALTLPANADFPFRIVWNGPSSTCSDDVPTDTVTRCPPNVALTPGDYDIEVNSNQAFNGSIITLFYNIEFPRLNASLDEIPCWDKKPNKTCSWSPWGDIEPLVNGGVPQKANLSKHKAAVAAAVANTIVDENFDGLAIIDWEAWRPLTAENDDGLSCCKSPPTAFPTGLLTKHACRCAVVYLNPLFLRHSRNADS